MHAFSPLEVSHGASTSGTTVPRYLKRLRDAGLGSLPGTAAEVLDDSVRSILCPDKLNTAEWLSVVSAAHGKFILTLVWAIVLTCFVYRRWRADHVHSDVRSRRYRRSGRVGQALTAFAWGARRERFQKRPRVHGVCPAALRSLRSAGVPQRCVFICSLTVCPYELCVFQARRGGGRRFASVSSRTPSGGSRWAPRV